MYIESLCTPSQHIKEGNLAAHVAMPSVPSPNEIVVAQQTVKNEENARSHTRSIPCLKAISRRPNCCILRPVCHQHRGAEDLATIAPQGVSSASPPLTGFPGSERLPCAYYELSKVVRTRKRGDSHQNFPLFDLIQVVFVRFRFPIPFYPEMGVILSPNP